MAVAIYQLNVPDVVQEKIKEYVFYSEAESKQRVYKKHLMHHLSQCERWCFTDGVTTSLYYKQLLKTTLFSYSKHWYSIYEYSIMHAGFCNDCHNYLYANTSIPMTIECSCMPNLIVDVD
jgi:hypothetical protein